MERRKMKRWIRMLSIVAVVALVAVLTQSALAGKFHFNNVNFSLGGSLLLQGDLAGLGNDVATVELTGYGTVTALCQNNGGHVAPGRNPIAAQVQQTNVFVTDENGKAFVQVAAPDPTAPGFEPSPTPKEAGCPSAKWTVIDMADGSTNWTSANIKVYDDLGALQLDLWYACTTTFENGVGVSVSCTETQ